MQPLVIWYLILLVYRPIWRWQKNHLNLFLKIVFRVCPVYCIFPARFASKYLCFFFLYLAGDTACKYSIIQGKRKDNKTWGMKMRKNLKEARQKAGMTQDYAWIFDKRASCKIWEKFKSIAIAASFNHSGILKVFFTARELVRFL